MADIKLTIWNEFQHEKKHEAVKKVYPDGIHRTLARHFEGLDGISVRTATLEEPEHGLTDEVLNDTDVLFWWGHMAHHEVQDEIAWRVHGRVLNGMGLVVLHSGHFSKPFRFLMGTSGCLRWREAGEKERLWVTAPGHPIAAGVGEYFELEQTEMYGEFFDVPQPDELIFISWFAGGEVFRSGALWNRGLGKVFYFRPGHETYPIYEDNHVLGVLENATRYLKFRGNEQVKLECANSEPLERL